MKPTNWPARLMEPGVVLRRQGLGAEVSVADAGLRAHRQRLLDEEGPGLVSRYFAQRWLSLMGPEWTALVILLRCDTTPRVSSRGHSISSLAHNLRCSDQTVRRMLQYWSSPFPTPEGEWAAPKPEEFLRWLAVRWYVPSFTSPSGRPHVFTVLLGDVLHPEDRADGGRDFALQCGWTTPDTEVAPPSPETPAHTWKAPHPSSGAWEVWNFPSRYS